MADVKWSSWTNVGVPTTGDTLVGLRSGVNVQFTPPASFSNLANLYALTSATGALNATYANGTAGVGATLTDASGTFLAFENDGVTYSLNQTIWVNDQANLFQNGLYYLSTNGDGVSVPWILTRATNFDTSPQMIPGSQITIYSGETLASSIYVLLSPQPVTIGTDDISSESMLELAVANQPAHTLLGNPDGTSAIAQPITLGTGLSFVSGALTVTGGSGPWNAGSGTGSAIGGDGSCTAAGNYTISFGSGNTVAPVFAVAFGLNNTVSSSGFYSLTAGSGNTMNGQSAILGHANNVAANYALAVGNGNFVYQDNGITFGSNCVSNGLYAFAFGSASHANGNNSYALGSSAVANNNGSVVWGDNNGSPASDSANNQFVRSFAGGFYDYAGSTLVTSIDTNSNFIIHAGIADQSYSVQVPSDGFSITIPSTVRTLTLLPASSLSTGTITLPAVIDGQCIRVNSSMAITTLTLVGDGSDIINNAPVTLGAGQGFDLQYNLANTAWNPLYQSSVGGGGASVWTVTGTNSGIGGDGSAAANNNYSLAYGDASTTANGNNCFAFGTAAAATNNYGFAFGNGTTAAGEYAFAFGNGSNSNGTNAIAMGLNSYATNTDSVCLGNHAQSNYAGSFIFADGSGTAQTDTAANQFINNFNGGYKWFVTNTQVLSIDDSLNLISSRGFADQSYSYQNPTTGFSITITSQCDSLILDPSTPLATGTVTLPASPIDGQIVQISTSQTIASMTFSPNAGQTISPPVTGINFVSNTPYKFQYVLGVTSWFQVA